MSIFTVLEEVAKERDRQNEKWGIQSHTQADWLMILGEEVGEACKASVDHRFDEDRLDTMDIRQVNRLINYREEMIQVAAVAVAMVQDFDIRNPHVLRMMKIKTKKDGN